MKVVFSALHFGFLRNFEPVLRALASRGHRVHLAADRRDKLGGETLIEGLTRDYPGLFTSELASAEKDRLWFRHAQAVRGSLDYLRYLDPRYHNALKLRDRAAEYAIGPARLLGRLPAAAGHPAARGAAALLRTLERAIPPRQCVEDLLDRERPDILLLTPLLYFSCQQVDFVRAARARGIPCMLGVGSWDHLTTKGGIHEIPDAIVVWNHAQEREAIELHNVPPGRIVVTGAQAYDHWFTRRPTLSREEFFGRLGLDPARPMLLYLCSSPFIAPQEVGFVRRWLETLRRSESDVVRHVNVLVRPHPQNAEQWADVRFEDVPGVAIWPRGGANPIVEDARADYFHSMFYSAAVIGVNTSAQIESAILGRPVLTVLAPEFALTQEGTLHFQHLNEGLLQVGDTLETHVEQVARILEQPGAGADRSAAFVQAFVRPRGRDVVATDVFIEAIERLAGQPRAASRLPATRRLVRAASVPVAALSWLADPRRRKARAADRRREAEKAARPAAAAKKSAK
jgi:hypothetical protein